MGSFLDAPLDQLCPYHSHRLNDGHPYPSGSSPPFPFPFGAALNLLPTFDGVDGPGVSIGLAPGDRDLLLTCSCPNSPAKPLETALCIDPVIAIGMGMGIIIDIGRGNDAALLFSRFGTGMGVVPSGSKRVCRAKRHMSASFPALCIFTAGTNTPFPIGAAEGPRERKRFSRLSVVPVARGWGLPGVEVFGSGIDGRCPAEKRARS